MNKIAEQLRTNAQAVLVPHAKDGLPEAAIAGALQMAAVEIDRLEIEEDHLQRLVIRQGKLLTGVVNAIRGEPGEMAMHSVHDAPVLARCAMELLRELAKRARACVVWPDDPLMRAALKAAEDFMAPANLAAPGTPLPGWEDVSQKAERGEPLNPIEAIVMRLTPADDDRAQDFRRMLRAALDYTAQQPKVDER